MRKRSLAAIAALGLGGSFLIGGFIASPALAASAGNVDIRVELDVLYPGGVPAGSGPAVFEVADAPIGPGVELTSADLVSNPSDWCGSITVDVDPSAKTVTVSAEVECDFTDVKVWVTSPDFGSSMSLVSDNLLWPKDDECSGECGGDGEGEGDGDQCEGECPGGTAPPVFSLGGGSGMTFSASRIVPLTAPGSLATLTYTFASSQLFAHWSTDQNGDSRAEYLRGATVFSYAAQAAPTPPVKVSTAVLSPADAWVWIGAATFGLAGAVAVGGALMLRRREG